VCSHLGLHTVRGHFCHLGSFCRGLRRLGCNGRRCAKASCAAEAAGTPYCVFQLINDDYAGHDDALDDELGDAVTDLDGEIVLGEVGEDDADGAAVVCVDYAGEGVDAVFVGEAGAGCYSAVY